MPCDYVICATDLVTLIQGVLAFKGRLAVRVFSVQPREWLETRIKTLVIEKLVPDVANHFVAYRAQIFSFLNNHTSLS